MTNLDQLLPYLVNRLGPRIEAGFAEPLLANGISLPMWRVLAAVQMRGPQGLGDLAVATSMPLSSMSRLITEMVDLDLLSRVRSERDGRAVRVDMTEKGRRVAAAVAPLAERYEAQMAHGFAEEEVAALKDLLIRLYANMEDIETMWRAAAE